MKNKDAFQRWGRALATLTVLSVWKLLSLLFPPMVIPPISEVFQKLLEIAGTEIFYRSIGLTSMRLAVGLTAGVLLGSATGCLMGHSPKIRSVLSPLVHLFQTIPPVSWVVMALLWFGFNGKPAIFIIITATLPILAISVAEGWSQMDRGYWEMAAVYRLSLSKKVRHILLPSLLPFFRSGLQVALGGSWKIAVMGEVLTTSDGIGGMVKNARLNMEPETVIAWTVIIVLLFYASDAFMKLCFRSKKEREYVANQGS